MNRLTFILLVLLSTSVGFNFYLFQQNQKLNQEISPIAQTINSSPNTISLAPSTKKHNITEQQPTSDQPLTAEQLVTKANNAFDHQQFDHAISYYEELSLINESQTQIVKQRWLKQLRQWLNDQNWLVLESFLPLYINRFSYDAQVLVIRADSYAAQNKPNEAIEQYIDLRSSSFDNVQEEFYSARIRHIANEHIANLHQYKAWSELINFSEQLLAQDPNFPPYVLAQAKGLIELEDLDYAQDLLEPIQDISFYRQQAVDLLNEIDKARLHQTAIALQPIGEHYLINGRINRTNPVQLMIDTGASISVLTRAMFDEIAPWTDPVFERDSLINTAGGQINAPIYRFEQFQINEFVVRDVSFVVIELDNMRNYHGLLGMNFLKEFKFEIDQQENLLVLSPK